MHKYIPSDIEPKWQKKWAEDRLYQTQLDESKNKYYVLIEFSYPSGDLHMGHWFAFAVPDILARAKRMQGHQVFFPNGFDAFGLPAENAAIKMGVHPKDWTLSNIEKMKSQFSTMGASFDWDHEVISCLPEYYKWNQWIFLKMFEKGLTYKGKVLSNWCPNDKSVLANENVEAGKCWRCGAEIVQKEVEQWFLKITDYAQKLLWSDPPSMDWPKSLIEGQNNWIGKSEGLLLKFGDPSTSLETSIEVFTTRIDTIFGATFIVISPEHPLLKKYIKHEKEVEEYLALVKKKSELERKESKEKTGVFTGSFIKNPLTNKQIPVWIADYVLLSYGTGAVMGVPAHDQRDFKFAKKYGLEIRPVILSPGDEGSLALASRSENASTNIKSEILRSAQNDTKAYEGEGVLINSGQYDGLNSSDAREKLSKYIENNHLGYRKTNYHLHDWSVSRQRYWGTPIPIIYCDDCGSVPVPEKDLPVELPYKVDYAPKGKPPLATAEDWVNVKCPNCGGQAKREVETMDTFFDSSWYFFRYLDPKNEKEIFDQKVVEDWLPLEVYFGGAEHTLGHTLYSRFFTKFFQDLGLISFGEYAKKRINRGLILGPDGQKMSKSRGNVVNPDEQVKKYGADAVRLYLAFIGPYAETVAPWEDTGLWGVYHFLKRVWNLKDKVTEGHPELDSGSIKIMHRTIKKVTEDINNIKFNTAVASMMQWLNYLSAKVVVQTDEYKILLLLLAPFAPHITEELWSSEAGLNEKYSIHQQSWPKIDNKYLEDEEVSVVVQINGKSRDVILIQKDLLNNREEVESKAKQSEKITKFLGNSSIKKVIYVPGKVFNFVI